MRMRIAWDIKLFQAGLIRTNASIEKGGADGLSRAIHALKLDALETPPSCPVDTGHMYDSHTVSSTNKTAALVVSTSYAAAVHEGIAGERMATKYKRPGSGPKWIESKLIKHQFVYRNRIVEGIANALRRTFGRFFK